MAVIVVTHAELVRDADGDMLRLEYRLPANTTGPLGDADGGHQHLIPVRAVWVRMAVYGVAKAEAVEEAVVERVASSALGETWPAPADRRAKARAVHDVAGVRRHAALVPDPPPGELDRLRARFGAVR